MNEDVADEVREDLKEHRRLARGKAGAKGIVLSRVNSWDAPWKRITALPSGRFPLDSRAPISRRAQVNG